MNKEQLIDKCCTPTEEVNKVYDIFKEFFGENKVDLQLNEDFKSDVECYAETHDTEFSIEEVIEEVTTELANTPFFILVYFPNVTITNEQNKSVNIHDLYVKVFLNYNGKTTEMFKMTVTTFTKTLYENKYTHSHLPSGALVRGKAKFATPCVGRGPIGDTWAYLNHTYDEDMWKLFCVELARYVTVESISGVPYHRMASINKSSSSDKIRLVDINIHYDFSCIKKIIRETIVNLINKKAFNFKYTNKIYSFADSEADIIRIISNEFIDIYNKKFNAKEVNATINELIRSTVLMEVFFYKGDCNKKLLTRMVDAPSTDVLFTFKGRPVKMRILDSTTDINPVYILNPYFIGKEIRNILEFINYNYEQEYIEKTR